MNQKGITFGVVTIADKFTATVAVVQNVQIVVNRI